MPDAEPTTTFNAAHPPPFRFTTLRQADRRDIVQLTTSGAAADLLQVGTFELGALGANVDLAGHWNNQAIEVASWTERGQGGRTERSVFVQRGYLFPHGHRAS